MLEPHRSHASAQANIRRSGRHTRLEARVTLGDRTDRRPARDIRLIETEVSVAVFAVAFRGPTGWLPNRLPTASAVAVWLYIEVPACRVSPRRGSKEGRAPAP